MPGSLASTLEVSVSSRSRGDVIAARDDTSGREEGENSDYPFHSVLEYQGCPLAKFNWTQLNVECWEMTLIAVCV